MAAIKDLLFTIDLAQQRIYVVLALNVKDIFLSALAKIQPKKVAALTLLSISASAYAAEQGFISAVSPDFPTGLHSKYLKYLSNELSMPVEIKLMPFARKIKAIQAGELDLVFGIQDFNTPTSDTLIYIHPPYYSDASALFVRAENKTLVNKYQDLTSLLIGVSERAQYFDLFDNDNSLAKIQLLSLSQKIKLLNSKRIDAFFHNAESTELTLKKMQLGEQIVQANFQPVQKRHYYIAISKSSFLAQRTEQLENIIKKSIDNGEFKRIRNQHYQVIATTE